jgi:hypothetical protein
MADEDPFDPLPTPPSFSDDALRQCKEVDDYTPILFGWYKFVGGLTVFVANIRRDSPAYRQISQQHYHILIGLLNRCARLMLSNIALSHEGRFGETTAIVDRRIFESGVKLIWLCIDPCQEKFTRYLVDGLKTELEFKAKIEANVASREGKAQPIERRMLTSIANHIAAAGLSEGEIAGARKLPDLATILSTIGFDRLVYIAAQKIGSHHIHGTWPSLLFHYLEEEPGGSGLFVPRDHDCSTHINQFMFVPVIMLAAMTAYVRYAFQDSDESRALESLFSSTEAEILRIYTEAMGGDLGS